MVGSAAPAVSRRVNRAAAFLAGALVFALPEGTSGAVRIVGNVAIRGRDGGNVVAEIAPSRIRVEIHQVGRDWIAGYDGERAWAYEGRSARVRPIPIPAALAREVAELVFEAAALPPAGGGVPQRDVRNVGGGMAWFEEGRIRRWQGRLGGARPREVELSFDGEVAIPGAEFPACIGIGVPGAAPEIVVDVFRLEDEPAADPVWFLAPPP